MRNKEAAGRNGVFPKRSAVVHCPFLFFFFFFLSFSVCVYVCVCVFFFFKKNSEHGWNQD